MGSVTHVKSEVLVSCLQAAQVRSAISNMPKKKAGYLASGRSEARLHLPLLFKMPTYFYFLSVKHKVQHMRAGCFGAEQALGLRWNLEFLFFPLGLACIILPALC